LHSGILVSDANCIRCELRLYHVAADEDVRTNPAEQYSTNYTATTPSLQYIIYKNIYYKAKPPLVRALWDASP
jgi:hypothetical protein